MRRIPKTTPFYIFESLPLRYAQNGLPDLMAFSAPSCGSSLEREKLHRVVDHVVGFDYRHPSFRPFSQPLHHPLLFLLSPCRSTPSRSLCRSPLYIWRNEQCRMPTWSPSLRLGVVFGMRCHSFTGGDFDTTLSSPYVVLFLL